MISLWLTLAVLLLVAAIFIFWPLFRFRKVAGSPILDQGEVRLRLAENVRIFREHLAELEANLATDAIDQTQFAQLKLELERNLLDDETSLRAINKKSSQWLGAKFVLVLSAITILGGIFFYQKRGSVDDVYIYSLQQAKMQQDYQDMLQNRNPDTARSQTLIAEFKARLVAKPDSVQYWFLLARAYMEISNFDAAVGAYQQILQRDPQSPMIMAELAQAMFLRDGSKMSQAVVDLAKSAVTLDPQNTMALGLLGIDAFGRKDYRTTIRYWQKAIDVVGTDSQGGMALVRGIERAKTQFVAEGGKEEDLVAKSVYAVKLIVSIGPNARVSKDQVVFIYARAWKGSPMPLAISRIKVSDLPQIITLDETMAMSPVASLATATEIEVVARISPEGSAQAKIGDWQAKQGPISMKSIPSQIELVVNEQLTADTLNSQP